MSKRDKFLEACSKEKLDTVRWSLGAGGQSPSARDADGYTAIMLCAMNNKHKALQMLVDHCRKTREREQMDLVDGAGDGRTALMMAAARGHARSCQELLDAGCNYRVKCDRGKTAADHARDAGHADLAARIDRGGESEEESSDEEDGSGNVSDGAPEGETSTQRSKRKKRERMEAAMSSQAVERAKEEREEKLRAAEAEAAAAADAAKNRPAPIWPEVEKATSAGLKELAIERAPPPDAPPLPAGAEVDPATWWADSVNTLKIALGARFTVLPPDVSRLKHLRTLIVSDNALTALPAELGALTSLKVLEAENNRIAELPAEALERCVALENLRLAGNALTSVAPLANCASLVTLVVDRNPGLVSLDALEFETKERLVTLSAKKCGLASVPQGAREVRAPRRSVPDG
jgi:leucine-rich repeat protein SHOC2